jgi:glycosyltransferase involved in cell wall biosynthesis
MEELVSVVMPVYNQEKFLAETIESVLAQTYHNFELIILDDGSTDKTADIIKAFAVKDNRIIPFFRANSGRANATNFAVSKANGKLCALIDADDLMMPNRLEIQITFHLANPEVAGTSCHAFFINDKGQLLGKQRHPALTTIEEGKKALANNDIIYCSITGLMIYKDVFLKVGGLRANFWPCDDVDFANRTMEAGFPLIIIQEFLMKYRMHPYATTTKKPLHVFDMYGYVGHCNKMRRTGRPEITFEEYVAEREKAETWWVAFNRKRYNYAQIYFRHAAYEIMSKHYLKFMLQVSLSSFLSPKYVFKKFMVLSK